MEIKKKLKNEILVLLSSGKKQSLVYSDNGAGGEYSEITNNKMIRITEEQAKEYLKNPGTDIMTFRINRKKWTGDLASPGGLSFGGPELPELPEILKGRKGLNIEADSQETISAILKLQNIE